MKITIDDGEDVVELDIQTEEIKLSEGVYRARIDKWDIAKAISRHVHQYQGVKFTTSTRKSK